MKYFDTDSIKVSDTGVVLLDNDQLKELESEYRIITAGGTNFVCGGSNGSGSANTYCGGSSNASCSNYSCSGSTNQQGCI